MEITSLGAPSTPVRASSAEASPPCRNPMDDSDLSQTRKRPRLDSGDRSYRSMSADELANTPSRNTLRHSPSTPARYQTATAKENETSVLPSVCGTPSKVTINVKDPLPDDSPPQTTASISGMDTKGGQGVFSQAPNVEGSTEAQASSPDVISVSSSASRSPEIEVAEVEDMNEMPGETRWRSLGEATEIQRRHLQDFPYVTRSRNPYHTIDAIITAIDKDEFPENDRPFKKLANWIEDYLEATETKSSRWWDIYSDQKEFWDHLPDILLALSKRSESSRFANIMRRILIYEGDIDHRQDLQDIIVAYAALAARMVQLDCQILGGLAHDTNLKFDSASQRYLEVLSSFSCQRSSNFWTTLKDSHQYDYHTTITAMTLRFVDAPGNGFDCIMHMLKMLMSRSSKQQGLLSLVIDALQVVNRMMYHYASLKEDGGVKTKAILEDLTGLPTKAYRIFIAVNSIYQTLIEKQVPALNHAVNHDLSTQLAHLLTSTARADDGVMASINHDYPGITDDLVTQYGSVVAEVTWKLLLCRKCLTEGRMELRVQGVEFMQMDLVTIYTNYMKKETPPDASPLGQYVADLLLANKVVEYLVGVDSHPQLIGRSANIVGFLVIAHRYRTIETDAIWRAVTSSQDSRTVAAILAMLNGFVNLADHESLLYLTTKLQQLPLQAFDASMMRYGVNLLRQLKGTWKNPEADKRMDMPPYRLCMRLLREVIADDSLPLVRRGELYTFAAHQLQQLLHLGPSEADLKTMYAGCIDDIKSCSRFATGSIYAINVLLAQDPEEGMKYLVQKYDLSRLLLEDLACQVDRGSFSNGTIEDVNEQLTPRLELMETIIRYSPDSLDVEKGQQLWDSLLGRQSLHNAFLRDKAWIMLVKAIHACSSSSLRNSFIDQCISVYLPKLDPLLFATQHCLAFVEHVTYYESRLSRLSRDGEEQPLALSGTALLWHLSLVVPIGSIELEAIHKLVALYLDSSKAKDSPRAALEATYVEVVDRCISQLTSAAAKLKAFGDGTSSGEDEPMVIVASEEEVQTQRLSFSRSLLILQEFVQGAKKRPMYSPLRPAISQFPPAREVLKGAPFQLKYQAFSGGVNTGIKSVEVGDLESFSELRERLAQLTGFEKFSAIVGGFQLNLDDDAEKTLREAGLEQKGFVLVKKAHDDDAPPDLAPISELMPLQREIMQHFTKLYPLLDLEDGLAKEVFDFLANFPPHESVTALVCAKGSPIEDVFPRQSPFKILYSVYALQSCLERQLRNGTISQSFISSGVRLLSTVLTTYDIVGSSLENEVDLAFAAGLMKCLLAFLRGLRPPDSCLVDSLFISNLVEPTSADISKDYILDSVTFIERLVSCLFAAQSLESTELSSDLVLDSFAVLLEASLHCPNVWETLQTAAGITALLGSILLKDTRLKVRDGAMARLNGIFAVLPTLHTSTASELGPFVWERLRTILPHSLDYPEHAKQLFDTILVVFKSLDHMYRDGTEMQANVEEWSHFLLAHRPLEVIGQDKTDWVAHGLTSLLQLCMQLAKSFKRPLQNDTLAETLFETLLFPPTSAYTSTDQICSRIPILHSQTRQKLYSIVLGMSNDINKHQKLLALGRKLLPEGEDPQAWSWGIAQLAEECPYEANWNLERTKLIRSPTGYPGMKNLSNTCYMNSLFTQLFMNLRFRDFILATNITDGDEQQKLLAETKAVFANMQETFLKSVDPQGIADSLTNYDGHLIDVSLQMDVDEFYNLLFDRWESQIPSDPDKKRFRGFFGGQIVQQIKSKECQHVSERLEPFSAIQCDIQGKRSLIDSLDAYVTGEVMEGENQYSCTSCGSYVDAEKRACFKDIPDNLIFHLKRFEYDVMSGTRSKINDKFEFPSELDMAPYHIDNLKETNHIASSDIFELVGVLVHSGTAESGHYYSYIRERPVNPCYGSSWVEYNDADLTRFDPSNIPDQCFGGLADTSPYTPWLKHWNAYCLFYQRRESINADIQAYHPSVLGIPVKTNVPDDLYNRIAINNEVFARKYCLLDPAHASFARSLLEQLRYLNNGVCSDSHQNERLAICLGLEHLNHVFSRAKNCFGFQEMLDSLKRFTDSCTSCCKIVLDWITLNETNLRPILLRCPSSKVREDFASFILGSLGYLKKADSQAYGFPIDESPDPNHEGILSEVSPYLSKVVQSLKDLTYQLPNNNRGWDEYFGLLANIAAAGYPEASLLLREGFLVTCLEYSIVEHVDAKEPLRRRNGAYGAYLRLLDRGRKYSFKNLIELLRILLDNVDLTSDPVAIEEGEDRPTIDGKAILSGTEEERLRFGSEARSPKTLVFLEKILTMNQNSVATAAIVRMLVLAEPEPSLLMPIHHTILGGVNVEPANHAEPFLQAALVFCELCPSQVTIKEMIRKIAMEVDTIGTNGGPEHLGFFRTARRLHNLRLSKGATFFTRLVLINAPYWAPALLMYYDEQVRNDTIGLLQILVFERDTQHMDDEAEADAIERTARDLCMACVKRVQSTVIHSQRIGDIRAIEQVERVIAHCAHRYCQDPDYRPQAAIAEAALDQLRLLAVSDVDDGLSDTWNNELSDNESESVSSDILT